MGQFHEQYSLCIMSYYLKFKISETLYNCVQFLPMFIGFREFISNEKAIDETNTELATKTVHL